MGFVCARGGERRVVSVLVLESFGGTAVVPVDAVQVEVAVDCRDGRRWRWVEFRLDGDLEYDFEVDLCEVVAVDVEPDDIDSRGMGEGGEVGDTRMPESAFDIGGSPWSSPSSVILPTALQKVARLEVLPPAVLGVWLFRTPDSGVFACWGWWWVETFSSYGKLAEAIRSLGRGAGERPDSSGVPVGVMEV